MIPVWDDLLVVCNLTTSTYQYVVFSLLLSLANHVMCCCYGLLYEVAAWDRCINWGEQLISDVILVFSVLLVLCFVHNICNSIYCGFVC